MGDVESKIRELMMKADYLYYAENESSAYDEIRETLKEIKDIINDTYNILDIWYQDGCSFPFEIDMNIDGEVRTVDFNSIREMLFTIRLLR